MHGAASRAAFQLWPEFMTKHHACSLPSSDVPFAPPPPRGLAVAAAAAPAAAAPAAPPPPAAAAVAPAAAQEESELGIEIHGTWYPMSQLTFVVELTYADGSTSVLQDQPH